MREEQGIEDKQSQRRKTRGRSEHVPTHKVHKTGEHKRPSHAHHARRKQDAVAAV